MTDPDQPDYVPDVIGDLRDDPGGPYCEVCGAELERIVCSQCDGSGFDGHDCGEDCCCCLDPEDNEACGQCDGRGAWWECPNAPHIRERVSPRRRRRSALRPAPDWWQERRMWQRLKAEERAARKRLDAGWRYLPLRFDPMSPKLPPAGEEVLLLGRAEVRVGWSHDYEHGIYRPVEVIRRGAWWSSIDSFVGADPDVDEGFEVLAWQPLPADADRWVAATQLPKGEG